MESTILLAALSAAEAAKTAASHAAPPGLKVALAHVPSGSEAMEVLKERLADITQAATATANKAVPPGLKVALAHVPSGSEAMEVLKQHLAAYTQAVAGAIRHGLHLGLGK